MVNRTTAKKKIAVFHNLPAGGAKRHTYEQIRELTRRGYEIHEYTQSTADLSFLPFDEYVAATLVYDLRWDELRPIPIPGLSPYAHIRQNQLNLARLALQSREIARQIDEEGFDLVFAKDCRYTIAPFVLRYLCTPTVFYMHSDPIFRSAAEIASPPSLIEKIRSRPLHQHEDMIYKEFIANLRHADRVLTNSRYTRDRVRHRHSIEAHVVYPGVDVNTFYPRPSMMAETFVLSAGNLGRRKGHWFVIESLGMLPVAQRPKLVVATPTADEAATRDLLTHAESRGVRMEVRVVGDSNKMADLYSAAQILVFAPSSIEALGLVALEAMACGTPVVGVNEGGLVETIQDGRTGFLVERDPRKFARAVERLLVDDALRDSFGRNARDYISAFWTWDRAVNDLEIEFSALLDVGVTVK